MNILEISAVVINHCLEEAFVKGTTYLSIPSVSKEPYTALPSVQASFVRGSGRVSLASPVQFAVPAGTIIDKVYISSGTLNTSSSPGYSDVIELEGNEIVDFTTSGIYLISAINITLTERND